MQKVFITIPWFLPAFRAGGPVQSIANLIKEYTSDVEYCIFCSNTDLNGVVLENITTDKWVPFSTNTKVWYSSRVSTAGVLLREVKQQNPDVLYVIGLYDWHFNIVPLLFCKAKKKILSVRGMLHPGALNQKKWKKKCYLSLFSLLGLRRRIVFHATDSEEARYIYRYIGNGSSVNIAGNFPNVIGELSSPPKATNELILVTVALISPMKNILLVLQALKNISIHIRYNIYGPVKDIDYWKRCEAVIASLPANINVVHHNEIQPLEVINALRDSHVFILPSESENFGHAIYEALSGGKPVITSNNTPWSNLKSANAGLNICIKDKDIENAIKFFAVMSSDELMSWQKGSSSYAVKQINLEKLKCEYHKMFAYK